MDGFAHLAMSFAAGLAWVALAYRARQGLIRQGIIRPGGELATDYALCLTIAAVWLLFAPAQIIWQALTKGRPE